MDLINATELYKVINGVTYLNVCALLNSDALNVLFSENEKFTKITVPLKETKTSHSFSAGTKQIFIKSEKVTKISYTFDETQFDAGDKAIITCGGALKLNGLNWDSKTIFFETDIDGADVEIWEFY